jgi:hypothetical protein
MFTAIDPSVLFAPPSIDDLPSDILPDPEGYYAGQEEYDFVKVNDDDEDELDAYDDMDQYEPDVLSYDSY